MKAKPAAEKLRQGVVRSGAALQGKVDKLKAKSAGQQP